MQLTNKDKEYLKSIGYEEKDFTQIEEAMNKSTFAIFKEGEIDKCKVVDYEKARDLLGNEGLLSGLSRSAFHFSSSREIPHTFGKYSISIDSGVLFVKIGQSKLLDKNDENFDLKEVELLRHNPCIKVSGIEWDTYDEDKEEYEEDIDLPKEILIPCYKIPGEVSTLDDVSEYLSNVTGFCHYGGYDIECNFTIDELYEMIKKIDKELDGEYEDGETTWASNLECMKEEIEAMICLVEETNCEKTMDN